MRYCFGAPTPASTGSIGAIGAVVARFVHTEEVTGSNPVSPTRGHAGQRPVPGDGAGLVPWGAVPRQARAGHPGRTVATSAQGHGHRTAGAASRCRGTPPFARRRVVRSAPRTSPRPPSVAGGVAHPPSRVVCARAVQGSRSRIRRGGSGGWDPGGTRPVTWVGGDRPGSRRRDAYEGGASTAHGRCPGGGRSPRAHILPLRRRPQASPPRSCAQGRGGVKGGPSPGPGVRARVPFAMRQGPGEGLNSIANPRGARVCVGAPGPA